MSQNWFLKDMLFIKLHMTKTFCNAAESVYTRSYYAEFNNAQLVVYKGFVVKFIDAIYYIYTQVA